MEFLNCDNAEDGKQRSFEQHQKKRGENRRYETQEMWCLTAVISTRPHCANAQNQTSSARGRPRHRPRPRYRYGTIQYSSLRYAFRDKKVSRYPILVAWLCCRAGPWKTGERGRRAGSTVKRGEGTLVPDSVGEAEVVKRVEVRLVHH
jgi:hypothetical protein